MYKRQVSILVPKLVIDFFKIIHIKEYNRPITQGLQMLDFIFIGAAVKQTGQDIVLLFQLTKKRIIKDEG